MKKEILIDIREIHEYKQEFVKWSINIPLSIIKECWLSMYDNFVGYKIILICRSGCRTIEAMNMLNNYFSDDTEINHIEWWILEYSKTNPTIKTKFKIWFNFFR